MYLVDTNVWLERLLDQDRSEEVARFLSAVSSSDIYITDFSFHSIAVILQRLNRLPDLSKFVNDVFRDGGVHLIHLGAEVTNGIAEACNEFKLDFDDAYQYVAAGKYNLTIVSFDSDFDRTDRKRKLPSEVR